MALGRGARPGVEAWAAGKSLPQPPYLISQMNEMQFQLRKAAPVLALLRLHGDLCGEHGQD